MKQTKNQSQNKIIRKLQLIKTNLKKQFKEAVPSPKIKFNTVIEGDDIPHYMVFFLLFGLVGLKNYGSYSKFLWHTYLSYKNSIFMIRESRLSSWVIEGITNDTHSLQLAREIRKCIVKSSRNLDPFLHNLVETEIQKNNFYLNNNFRTLISTYNFFKQKISDTLREYEKAQNAGLLTVDSPLSISSVLNRDHRLKTSLSNYSFALMSVFYSLMDFLMPAIYSFERSKETPTEFKEKRFHEKFKILFHSHVNPQSKKLYDELIEIRRSFRNPLIHGLLDSEYLVPFPVVGLIPLSYEHLSKKVTHRWIPIEKGEVIKIVDTFTRFLNWLESTKPYAFYMVYIGYNFSIPMKADRISKIKAEMSSIENFKVYCENEATYMDAIENRDIFL